MISTRNYRARTARLQSAYAALFDAGQLPSARGDAVRAAYGRLVRAHAAEPISPWGDGARER